MALNETMQSKVVAVFPSLHLSAVLLWVVLVSLLLLVVVVLFFPPPPSGWCCFPTSSFLGSAALGGADFRVFFLQTKFG